MAIPALSTPKGCGEDHLKQKMHKSLDLKQFGHASITHPHFTALEPEPKGHEAFSQALAASWRWSRARVGISEALGDSQPQ